MQTKHGKHQQLMKFQIVLLCLFFLVELNATPFYFKSYDMEDGLSNNHVTCCVQDDYGFMWFGTRDGLNRFDSKNSIHSRATLQKRLFNEQLYS